MEQTCQDCTAPFEITSEDLALLGKLAPSFGGKTYELPPAIHCPDCRQRRRLLHVNELNLYKRTCDLTGKPIVSNFPPDDPRRVYAQDAWYSDQWDPLATGRDVDFSRPFFDQIADLQTQTPLPALFTGYQYDENSEYTNYAGKNKNCYLIFDSDECWDCYYCYGMNGMRSSVDCYRTRGCELCYECVDCIRCYGSSFLRECDNCSDSLFLRNCSGCKNCLMCCNLKNKEYHVENKPVSKAEFAQYVAALKTRSALRSSAQHFREFSLRHPHKFIHGIQNENVSGDYLNQSKNARHCFDGTGLWDCAYVYRAFYPLKDSMDCEAPGGDEKLYETSVVGYNAQNCLCSANCLDQLSDIFCSMYCFHCQNLFGCVGLRRKKYCILNTQYTREEYESLVPRIVEHMIQTNEWGRFLPPSLSPFAYNETLAQDYYPLTKEQANQKGYRWRDPDPKEYRKHAETVPESIDEAPGDLVKKTFNCVTCAREYRLTQQEIDFYRQQSLPPPTECFSCRNRRRLLSRNPRQLWDRECMKCRKPIRTTYAPDRPEIVYCESCYLQAVY